MRWPSAHQLAGMLRQQAVDGALGQWLGRQHSTDSLHLVLLASGRRGARCIIVGVVFAAFTLGIVAGSRRDHRCGRRWERDGCDGLMVGRGRHFGGDMHFIVVLCCVFQWKVCTVLHWKSYIVFIKTFILCSWWRKLFVFVNSSIYNYLPNLSNTKPLYTILCKTKTTSKTTSLLSSGWCFYSIYTSFEPLATDTQKKVSIRSKDLNSLTQY